MAYIANKPDSTDAMSASQAVLKDNFTAIKTLVDVNHVSFGLTNEGKHNTVSIPAITVTGGSIPIATGANEWALYTDSVSGKLFLRPASQVAGTVTNDRPLTGIEGNAAKGRSYLPGVILQWGTGTVSGASSSNTGTFYGTFPTGLLSITFSLTGMSDPSRDARDYAGLYIAGSTTGWTMTRSSYNGAPIGFNYLAIGY